MADSYSGLGLFRGKDPDECEGFIATVRRRALEQGKHRDNEWMAVFASSYLGGEALYWYEGLDEDVQNDWSRLRPALLARFGEKGKAPTATTGASIVPTANSSATIPTPAAAPPAASPSSLVRMGRLKAFGSNGRLRGYIRKSADSWYENLSTFPNGALLVSFTSSEDGPFDIQIIDTLQNPQAIDVLAIGWLALSIGQWLSQHYFVARCGSLSAMNGLDANRTVWKISKDGELCVEYPKPRGGTERLRAAIRQSDNCLHWLRPSRSDVRDYDLIRLVFEDAT